MSKRPESGPVGGGLRPVTFRRDTASRFRMTRVSKIGLAGDAIGKLSAGMELYVLTFGQFSLIDALAYLVEQTGPADVDVAVWTAAHADITRAIDLLERSHVRRMRWVVDRSFASREPACIQRMRDSFGDAAIRVTATHCKFAAIRTERWNLAVRTSMNLNENTRLENLEISDDRAFCGFLTGVVDSIFEEAAEGDFRAKMTAMAAVPGVPVPGQITAADLGRKLPYPSSRSLQR